MKFALRVAALLVLVLVAAGLVFYRYPLWVADQQIRFHLWREGVKSEYVEAGGYRLHYFEALPRNGGGGTPLVLVHGLGARGEDWSPKPDVDYSISLQEQTVAEFMRAMNVPRADVGGWSMGGWVVMKLALDHP